jgi:DNA-binding MarR family transcriptional regulator
MTLPDPHDGGPQLGEMVQDFVNRVSHRAGRTLAAMQDGSVTLPQVLLLHRLADLTDGTASELAEQLKMSLSSVSQMLDRLETLQLVTRSDVAGDRRKRRLKLTAKARALLRRLRAARSDDYEAGLSDISPRLRALLRDVLTQVLNELAPRQPLQPAS